MNFPTLPTTQPAITTNVAFATIAAAHGSGPDGLVYHDQVTYDIYILGPNGPSPKMEGVKPSNEWMQGTNSQPRLKVVPASVGSEWPCQISTTRLLLWTWETPGAAPCADSGPPLNPDDTPPVDDTPPGGPGIGDGPPIGFPRLPPLVPVSGRMAPLLRAVAGMTNAEIAALGDIIDIARSNRA